MKELIEDLSRIHQTFPPVSQDEMALLKEKGVNDEMLEFYSHTNGAFIHEIEGQGRWKFKGKEFDWAIPSVDYLVNMYEFGFVYDDADYIEESHTWYMTLDLGDGDCLAMETKGKNRVLFMDHEQSGWRGCHPIIASSLKDMIKLLFLPQDEFWEHCRKSESNTL